MDFSKGFFLLYSCQNEKYVLYYKCHIILIIKICQKSITFLFLTYHISVEMRYRNNVC